MYTGLDENSPPDIVTCVPAGPLVGKTDIVPLLCAFAVGTVVIDKTNIIANKKVNPAEANLVFEQVETLFN